MKYQLTLLLYLVLFVLNSKAQKYAAHTDTSNMVLVERPVFLMGIDSTQMANDASRFNVPPSFLTQEYPALRVYTQPFYLDKYEVTNADFKKFIEANPKWTKSNIPDSLHDGNYLKDWKGNKYPKGKANYPVVYVCFYAANAYANWKGKRLPSESERECAARGLNDGVTEFPWGNADADTTRANFLKSNIGHAVQVGSYPPNGLGLYNMAGNVWEYCADRWHENIRPYLANFKKTNGYGFQSSDQNRVVLKGGSWNSPAVSLRTTYRESGLIKNCSADVGFRCAANTYKSSK